MRNVVVPSLDHVIAQYNEPLTIQTSEYSAINWLNL